MFKIIATILMLGGCATAPLARSPRRELTMADANNFLCAELCRKVLAPGTVLAQASPDSCVCWQVSPSNPGRAGASALAQFHGAGWRDAAIDVIAVLP